MIQAPPAHKLYPASWFCGGGGILRVLAGHTKACYFLFCGAQLYKTMLLQVMPIYLCNLRKRLVHAGLRGVPMKRFAALWHTK